MALAQNLLKAIGAGILTYLTFLGLMTFVQPNKSYDTNFEYAKDNLDSLILFCVIFIVMVLWSYFKKRRRKEEEE